MKKILLLLFFLSWADGLFAQTSIRFDFQADPVGKFPAGWSSRDPEKMAKVYRVQEEDGRRFLRGEARAESVQIGFERKWDLEDFPLLRWRWRARIFPEGTDERKRDGNDNVLSVYALFGGWPLPRAVKYVWSDTLPAGTALDSPHSPRTKVLVVRSGRALSGKWVSEERDLLADYRTLFGEPQAAPRARGILLLTDSDSTRTQARGDYEFIEAAVPGKR